MLIILNWWLVWQVKKKKSRSDWGGGGKWGAKPLTGGQMSPMPPPPLPGAATLLMVWRYVYKRQYTDETLTLRKSMNMRASELGKFLHFHILKLLFSSIFCWYFWYFISETYIFSGLKLQSAWYLYHQRSSLFLLTVWHYIKYTNDSIPTKHWHWTNLCMYVYASELRTFTHFYILKVKLLLLSICCWYFRYRYKWHACRLTCTNKTPKKHWWGGGGGEIAPAPLWLR